MFLKGSNRLAIVDFDGSKINYDKMVNSIKYLSRNYFKNIFENEHALIVMENRKEWIYSFFAIWDKKATAICVDALSNEEELTYYINDSDANSVIVSNTTLPLIKSIVDKLDRKVNIYNIDDFEIKELVDDIDLQHPIGDETAVMVYTSGTTGNSKGVMLSYETLIAEIEGIKGFKITKDDEQVIAFLPYHHILPLMSTCIYMYYHENQYSVVMVEKLTSTEILKKLQENQITMISAVPRVYKLFYKSLSDKINSSFITRLLYSIVKKVNNKKFSRIVFAKVHRAFGPKLRSMVVGGGKSELEMIEFFETLGFNYYEGYGLSETSSVLSGSIPKHYKKGTVGKPMHNVETKVVNGELWARGPIVMKGYYNKPEKTREVLTEDGWFKTGDLVEVDEDGYITIIGRANSMIVLSNGKNIDPETLENRVMKIADNKIVEIGIFGKNDKLSAVIVANKGISNISTYIRDIIQIYNRDAHNYEKILDYKIVNQELPKTRVGKLRRFMLAEIFGGNVKKSEIVSEPTTREYKILKDYITKVKNTEVGPDENLEIEIGLDSLDQVELISYIENSFGIKMDENLISNYSNLRLLSEYIHKTSSDFNENEIKLDTIIKNAPYQKISASILPTLVRPLLYIVFKLYFRFTVKGREKISDKPTIFIANHESFVDAPLLFLALPNKIQRKTHYLGLEQYFNNTFMKFVAKNSNVITINIGKDIKSSLEKISNVLKQGENVCIFPEGSRTKDGNLAEFKKVFAIVGKELNVDIQCLFIEGAYEAYSRFDKFPRPNKLSVEVLDTIKTENKSYEEIVKEAEKIYKDHKESKNK